MSDSLKSGIMYPGVGARLQRALPSRNWVALILALLILDQGIKIAVLLTLAPHQDVPLIGRWVMLRLELNDGTALGFPFASELDRYLRILLKAGLAVVVFLSLALFQRRRGPRLLLIGLALCVAGLVGNLIDRVAHGALLGNALPRYATRWFHGRIIDMFSCPLVFGPVFNFADAVLTVGGMLAFVGLIRFRYAKSVIVT